MPQAVSDWLSAISASSLPSAAPLSSAALGLARARHRRQQDRRASSSARPAPPPRSTAPHRAAGCDPRPPSTARSMRGVLGRLAAAQVVGRAHGRRPKRCGIQLEGGHPTIAQVAHPVRSRRWSARPARRGRGRRRPPGRPAAPSTSASGCGERRVVDADQLVRGAGRVGQRAEQVEDGALRPARGAGRWHTSSPGGNFGANRKPMPTCSMHVRHLLRASGRG